MSYIFFGATKFSEEILLCLIENGHYPSAIFTIAEEFNISYSDSKVKNYNFSDLKLIAEKIKVPCYLIDSGDKGKKTSDYFEIIKEIKPKVILVMGWYYMLPAKIRELAEYGAWGIHASLLPNYAGGAPLVWAIINGEKITGATLFQLSDGVDDGDIIDQMQVEIDDHESIREVYSKITEVSKTMLVKALQDIDNIKLIKQDKSLIKVYPQRKPDDGELDLRKPAAELYNFIRAQSSPYPGAFIRTVDGRKLVIEKARVE